MQGSFFSQAGVRDEVGRPRGDDGAERRGDAAVEVAYTLHHRSAGLQERLFGGIEATYNHMKNQIPTTIDNI